MKADESRRTHPRDWGVRTKAGVIVAVPLLVLGGFGGAQIADEVQKASHSAALAEQISILPAIMRYATSVGARVGLDVFGLTLDETNAILADYTEPLEVLATREDLDPVVSDGITRILSDGRALTDAAAVPGADVTVQIEHMREFGMQVQQTVRALVDQTQNATALDESGRLLDLYQARLMPYDQTIAFTQSVADSGVARELLETAFASERAVHARLRGADEDQQALAELRAAVEARHTLLLSPVGSATRMTELTTSLLTGVEIGNRLMDASVGRIVTELAKQREIARGAAVRTAVVVAAAISCAVAITLGLAGLLVSSLRRLRDDTTRIAYQDLPAAVAAIRGHTDRATGAVGPIGVNTTEEIGQVARAVDGVNAQALLLATEQAALRRQITVMFETLARRNRSLVDRQLALIETLEFKERDPQRLQNLFELDHLAARMRRTGESLLVLAGTRNRRASRADTLLEDVLRAAVSQVENYERVRLGTIPPAILIGNVVDDLLHLLTELLDNSLRASDPTTVVAFVVSPAVESGLLLEIVDRGIGIPEDEVKRINQRLAEGTEVDAQATRHMGLYVVGRVAQRHRLQVRLRPTVEAGMARGITASVYLPSGLIIGSNTEITWGTVDRPRRLPEYNSIGTRAE